MAAWEPPLTGPLRQGDPRHVKRFATGGRVTIGDVAERAAVSKTTVSHVLSGNRPVAASTRARVVAAIDELGYRPDGLARSLRTRRTHMVALVIPDITNPFYPFLARGLDDGLDGSYRTFIFSTDAKPERERKFLSEVADRSADGIVIDSFTMDVDMMAATLPGIPLVRVGISVIDDPHFDTVHAEDERGAALATKHLIDRGHRRIAMIQGPQGAGAHRNLGYLNELDAAGISPDPELVLAGEWTRTGGHDAAMQLLSLNEPPTAIFCANDLMALGALDACRELGKQVPRDVAIVGFDDIDAARMVSPALTTVSNPAYETGLLAGVLLLERMTGGYTGPPRTVTLPCRLVQRSTS
jgi:LacI family transcriptional regulator